MIIGELKLPKMDGVMIRPGVQLIGEPSVVDGQLRCLANVAGALCVVELSVTLSAAIEHADSTPHTSRSHH